MKLVCDQDVDRLDRYLSERISDLSRARLQRLIRDGRVTVDGEVRKAGRPLRKGEVILVILPEEEPPQIAPEDIPVDIVYQDDDLAVVNKPAGLVMHPGSGVHSGTLINALVHHLDRIASLGSPLRPGIVHRLDKDTSGLVVVAKTDMAYAGLARAIKKRETKRCYLAVVWGIVPEDAGTIDTQLGRSRTDRKRMIVLPEGIGKRAITHYRVKERLPCVTVLSVRLETGRTHQIRSHFKHLGHPILGDPRYGGTTRRLRDLTASDNMLMREVLTGLRRQFLHAEGLEFPHPKTGECMRFEASLPPDLEDALLRIRKYSGRASPPRGGFSA